MSGDDVGRASAPTEVAGFGVRLTAYIIDAVAVSLILLAALKMAGVDLMPRNIDPIVALVILIHIPLAFLPMVVAIVLEIAVPGWADTGPDPAVAGVVLAVLLAYHVGFPAWKAATPGKMALGLAIVDAETAERIGVRAAALRFAGYAISFLIFWIGFLMVGMSEKKRGLHDVMAGTAVVKDGGPR